MSRNMSKWVAPLRRRDGGDCQLCHRPIDFSLDLMDPMGRSVDHIQPLASGGQTILVNLRLAHRQCNGARGSSWNGEDLDDIRGRHARQRRNRAAAWDSWAAAVQPSDGLVIGDEPVLPCG